MAPKDDEARPAWQHYALLALWVLAFPFILVWYSIEKFLLPCLGEYVGSALSLCCFQLSSTLCKCCGELRFTDKEFPPVGASVGGDFAADPEVEWFRVSEIVTSTGKGGTIEGGDAEQAHLFDNGISPGDIAQGQLGDCWLLSAISVLAEKPGQIELIFKEMTHSHWGTYHLKLWSGQEKKWETLVIDDFVPTKHGAPLFTKPHGNEMWVLLLEKAFAKLVGSYEALSGGMPLWALEAMTGSKVAHFKLDDDHWQKMELVHLESAKERRKVGLKPVRNEKPYTTEDMFAILEQYNRLGAAMAAYSRGKSDKDQSSGIVQGHAYSILDVRHVNQGMGMLGGVGGETLHFLRLRNPWGTFSWEGAWSDGSKLWQEHSGVASALSFRDAGTKDDGAFWMVIEDFVKFFDAVDVCDREVGIRDVVLQIDEADGACLGPAKGCAKGCFRYWCLCEGATHLCCPHHSSDKTVKTRKICGMC